MESIRGMVRRWVRPSGGPGRVGLSWMSRVAAGLLAGVAVLAGIRAEGSVALVALTAVGGWTLVLAAPLAVVAVIRRQRGTAVLSLVLCVLHLGWLWTSHVGRGAQPAPAGASIVKLVSANLLVDNEAIDTLAAKLRDSGADVLCLQEVTPEHLTRLRAADLGSAYPHSVIDPLPGFHGSAIFSKLPLESAQAIDVHGSPMTTATIRLGAQLVRIVDVHTVAPLSPTNLARWRGQLADLTRMLPTDGRAAVLIGDFNATGDNRSLINLLRAGWRDAFEEAGDGFGFSYPCGIGPVTPLLRLDHAMVSEPLTVTRVRTADNPGSDHRMLAVEIAVPAAS